MKYYNNFNELYNAQSSADFSVFNALEEDWSATFQSQFPNLKLTVNRGSSWVEYKVELNEAISDKVWKLDRNVAQSEFPVLRNGIMGVSLKMDYDRGRYSLSPDRSSVIVPVEFFFDGGLSKNRKRVRTYVTIPYDGEIELTWDWNAPKFVDDVSEDAFYDVAKQIGMVDALLDVCAKEEAEIAKLKDYQLNPHFSIDVASKIPSAGLPIIPTADKWGTAGDEYVDAPAYDASYID